MILLLLSLGACKKSSQAVSNPLTPLQSLINTDTSLSLYHRMLLTANETRLLADNSVTLLIPTNSAFRAAGYTEVIIDSLKPSVADRIISYHFIPQRATPSTNSYTSYPTHLGFSIFGELDGNQTWFNGTVVGDTAEVGKALIYKLNSLLLSPMDSLLYQLSSDSTLSFTTELFSRTRLDTTLIQTQGNYTVLAPVNDAWRNAGYDSVGMIDSADFNTMLNLAKYHVLTERLFTNTLSGLTSVTTVQGGSLTVGVSGGVLQFSGTGNSTPAHVLTGNQPAGNVFVIHKIDELLSP
ncbi:fasciclin domain-containing protein [Flavitalea sp. BT771]|uniref:fasciclin domain-containing protein n=1 Tax=Flavitalea sp. BT771 TaxID=3063329 RepID=UPI0026E428CD|nr:fasciclin domain-containing protein [Flavitalea sp. BT771]MDO6433352.1 fasciclin domain-containing protein [Flavitalea sp. BT771]MDV6222743.1 fasciclin domain-containing protein [Flavitalea sp. BT771]